MSGWLRHFALSAQVRTGFSSDVVVWAVIAVIASTVALVFLLIAAFVWLANRYDSLTAGLVLGCVFVVIALIAVIACLVTRRRSMERARLELAARNSAGASFLDPKLLGVGFQIGQAIGWRKLAALAAVGLLAAGLAKEWLGRDAASPTGDEPPEG
jgi:Na+-translocating ferredoxin:NAD+ oxidoreductase RnfE subunit